MSEEEPNSTLWTAGGAADEFRSTQLLRAQRRHIWTACVLILVTILIGWMGYLNYQDARRQMLIEEFVSLRPSLETLHNPGNPAIESRIRQADKLRTAAGKQSGSEAVASLRTALGKLEEATEIDRDVERILALHQPVGIKLNETPWRSTSTVIESRVRELNQRHVQISSFLDAGDVREAEEKLASLLSDVGILQRDNVEALITSQTRQNWTRLNTSVPDRLKDDSELAVVRGIGTNAEQGWEAGDWINARALYGQASEHLQKFLESKLNPEEQGKLLASDAEAVARLETEKADFAKQIESLRQEKQSLNDQLATTNGQRLTAEKLVTALTTERDKLTKSATTAKAELGELRPLTQQLADTNARLKKAQEDLASLNTAKSQTDQDLQRVTKELSARPNEIAALRAAARDGNDNAELMRQRQGAEFPKLNADGKIPTAANMTMVAISPGTFTMGEGSDAHIVSITRPFFAGKHEVMIGQVLVWLNSPGVVFKNEWINLSDSNCPVWKLRNRFERNVSTKFASSDQQPMQNISHFGAIAFCEWCSKQDSRFKYRLPTEAEWEYMARAGSTSTYPWGDSCNGTEANVNGTNPHGTTNSGPYKQVTTTVGSYSPNAWGLHDIVGNTLEWCSDWYETSSYSSRPAIDPKGPSSGSSRVLRGGSWLYGAIDARPSLRDFTTPDVRYYTTGFRVVAE